ncbi:MAG: hypothetical protein KGL41_06385 [Actinomycetales bacterium]|nr:hypothetical protein [Actinomycetales bacterium]
MRSPVKLSAISLCLFLAASLSGCASGANDLNDSKSSAAATAAPGASAEQTEESATDAPAVAPTTNATSDPNQQVSLLDEKAFVNVLKPLGFACDASVIKAIELAGAQVQFSSVSCRRGQEPDVVLTLAASQNELELVTTASCQAATGTVLRTPIVVGGNWQLLSASANRPLLEELGKILHGKTMTIKELCG